MNEKNWDDASSVSDDYTLYIKMIAIHKLLKPSS